jgi:hypothetical protein
VTRPWFDYVMGTREFTAGSPRESNVLGLPWLPDWISRRLPQPQSLGIENAPAAAPPAARVSAMHAEPLAGTGPGRADFRRRRSSKKNS